MLKWWWWGAGSILCTDYQVYSRHRQCHSGLDAACATDCNIDMPAEDSSELPGHSDFLQISLGGVLSWGNGQHFDRLGPGSGRFFSVQLLYRPVLYDLAPPVVKHHPPICVYICHSLLIKSCNVIT